MNRSHTRQRTPLAALLLAAAAFFALAISGRPVLAVSAPGALGIDLGPILIRDISVVPRELSSAGGPVVISATVTGVKTEIAGARALVSLGDGEPQVVPLARIPDTNRYQGTFNAPANVTPFPQVFSVTIEAWDPFENSVMEDAGTITVLPAGDGGSTSARVFGGGAVDASGLGESFGRPIALVQLDVGPRRNGAPRGKILVTILGAGRRAIRLRSTRIDSITALDEGELQTRTVNITGMLRVGSSLVPFTAVAVDGDPGNPQDGSPQDAFVLTFGGVTIGGQLLPGGAGFGGGIEVQPIRIERPEQPL